MPKKEQKHTIDKTQSNDATANNSMRSKGRNFSKKYLQSRNFLSLLSKQRGEDLKLWQNLDPRYTDLLEEQLKTQRKINYLESLANFGHNNVRKVYLYFLPVNIIVFMLLCTLTPDSLKEYYTSSPYTFRCSFFLVIAMSITNLPMLIYIRRWWHDITYYRIQDRLGLLLFDYFEVVEKDKHIDGGYTKRDIYDILRRFQPDMPYTKNEIANYLQQIIEIEMERKPRGIVYYIFLKEKYFDEQEKKRQTENTSTKS